MIEFPDNPTLGEAFTHGTTIYTCVRISPVVWNASPLAAGIPDAPTDNLTYGRREAAWKALDKTDVGLSNVNNTSDAAKPISTATQTALNTKEPTIALGTAAQYWRGDKAWATLNKAAVGLGSADNTADANKMVHSALFVRSGASTTGALIPFSWADDGTQPAYVWGGNNVEGRVYSRANLSVNYANGAGYANNSGQVSGVGGWAYRNDSNNPIYLWCTEGDNQAQHLTRPENLSVWHSQRVATVEGAAGGSIQGNVYINGQLNQVVGGTFSMAYRCKNGVSGGYGANWQNIMWDGSGAYIFIDDTNIGRIAFTSDERVKHTITLLDSDTEAFLKINPITFRMKDIAIWKDDGKVRHGFSAQNCELFAPQLINGDTQAIGPDGEPQAATLDTVAILAHTVAQLKKALVRIAALEAK
jgi:hypothetical protein